ncbi:MAG: iron-containing alcohol dehydrogenase [Clostridia bacterium]|nr:iron-containing alcohol dehydrogenase [Clostridia bacterium]
MSIGVSYSKSRRMVVSGLSCDCPFDHRSITQDVYIGEGVSGGLAAMIKRRDLGKRLVLISDEYSYAVAGERVKQTLLAEQFDVTALVFPDNSVADESALGRALLAMRMDTDFFVCVGCDAVVEIARVLASQTERPLVLVATGASTAAYPSTIGKAYLAGLPVRIKGAGPELILCDTSILKLAPRLQLAKGYAEMMSRYLCIADWRLRRLTSCEKICPTFVKALGFAADRVYKSKDDIANARDRGIEILMESLILSGFITAQTGLIVPIESTEHSMADYCAMNGGQGYSYGALLAASVARCLRQIDRFRTAGHPPIGENLGAIDVDGEIAAGFKGNAGRVTDMWPGNVKKCLERQAGAFETMYKSILGIVNDMPASEDIIESMRDVGCFEEEVDDSLIDLASIYAAYMQGGLTLAGAARLLAV